MSPNHAEPSRLPASREAATTAGSVPPDASADEAALVERFHDRIRLFALRRLSDAAAAEDVAQETLRRVIEALRARRVRDRSALPGYVFQTARHVCLHRMRSAKRERRALDRFGRQPDDSARPAGALGGLISEERRATVRQALARLRADDRDLLRMFYYEGLETREVAGRLEIKPGTARVRKHRALRRLAAALEERGT